MMSKRLFAMVTVIVLCLTCFIPNEYKVKAATQYNRDKALAYFSEHVYDKDGKLCAEGVSDALEHGGISRSIAWSKGATTLHRQLMASGLGSEYKVKLNSDKSISVSNCSGKIEPGDVIFYYCSGCTDGCPYIHVVMYAGADSNGYAKCYSRNNSNNASKKYKYSKYCYSCGHEIKTAYVFHFNTETVQLLPDGWYKISSACDPSGNSVLNISGNSMDDGGNLIIYPWENTDNEIFYLKYEGNGYYSLKCKHSGKYLHVQDGSTVIVNVHQWSNLHDNALWYMEKAGGGYYYLRNKNNGAYLDLNGACTDPTTNIWTYTRNQTNAQKWLFTPYVEQGNKSTNYKSQLVANGYYRIATACDSSGNSVLNICGNSMEDGGNLIIYPWENTENEIFYLNYEGNGYYSLKCKHSGKYLHVQDGATVIVNVHQWTNLHNNALWYMEDTGGGYYYLRNKNNGAYLDLSGACTDPTTNIRTYTRNQTNAQKWRFIST